MRVKEKNGIWFGNKNGQEFIITGQSGDKYQKCVYEGDDYVILEGKPQHFQGDSTDKKNYTIFSIEKNSAKIKGEFFNRIDRFVVLDGNKIVVEEWDAANCYRQYYDLNGTKLGRDPFPIDTREKKKKREREQGQNKDSSDADSDNEENIVSNVDQIGNNVADAINSGLIPRRSKIVAYLWCVFLGWFGAHQVYLAFGKVRKINYKDYKNKNYIPSWRGLPFGIGFILLAVGAIRFFVLEPETIGVILFLIGLVICIIFWIIDLITLGKQVDKVNERIAKKFGY